MSYIKNSPEYQKYMEDAAREDTRSFDTYQDYRFFIEREAKKRKDSLPSDQQENKGNSAH